MEVIRKVAVILIFVALVTFVSNLADAEHSAKVNINTATVKEISIPWQSRPLLFSLQAVHWHIPTTTIPPLHLIGSFRKS